MARSGDILLISDSSINAYLINSICAARWSHVAIIYRNKNRFGGRPCIFEAVMHAGKEVDIIKKRSVGGVRLIDLETYLLQFTGNAVAFRYLMTNNRYDIQRQMRDRATRMIEEMIDEHHGKPYEFRWSEIVLARFPIIPRTSETPGAFFCSELVAYCYMNIGLIDPKAAVSSHFLPEEFSATGDLELLYPTGMPFTCFSPESKIVKLGDEMFIDTSKECV